jgi:hypothetical protein
MTWYKATICCVLVSHPGLHLKLMQAGHYHYAHPPPRATPFSFLRPPRIASWGGRGPPASPASTPLVVTHNLLTNCWYQVVGTTCNKSVELNNLVASCEQAVDNLSTSWEQAVWTHPVDNNLCVFTCVYDMHESHTWITRVSLDLAWNNFNVHISLNY